MKKLLPYLILASITLSFGCSSDKDELGIRDSRENFMVELEKALNENDIPYRTDDEGYIRYPSEYKDAVENLKSQVDQNMAREVATKFEDKQSTDYFRSLLDKNGISYRIETREDGEWTHWRPENQEQEEKFEMQVVNYAFEQQRAAKE